MGRCFFHVSRLVPEARLSGCHFEVQTSQPRSGSRPFGSAPVISQRKSVAAARSKLPKLNHALWMIYGSSFMMDLCQCEFLWIYNMKLNEFLWIESIHRLLDGSETTAVLDS